MTIVIALDLEDRLRAEAARRGTDPELLAIQAIEEKVGASPKQYGHLQRTLSPQEWVRQFEEWAQGNRWPTLPDEAYQRASFYEDR